VISSDRDTGMRRPAWMVLASLALSGAVFESPWRLLLRNTALVAASVDACLVLWRALPPGTISRRLWKE
jgi:hypothetical protein